MEELRLNNNMMIPVIGFGTHPQKEELVKSVDVAIEKGYRLFDTSDNYYNEEFLGKAIANRMDEDRKKIVVISKFSQPYRTKEVEKCFWESQGKVSNALNIYLLHWPYPFLWKKQWRAMEKLYLSGKCQAIGVCNFEVNKLKKLLKFCKVKPVINQIERHPLFQQNDIVEYCKGNDIQVMAYSPVARHDKDLFESKELKDIAEKYSKTISQVVLRWDIDTGVIPIPGSRSEEHIEENFKIFDFSLNEKELDQISKLEMGKRIRFDPKKRFSKKEIFRFLLARGKMGLG